MNRTYSNPKLHTALTLAGLASASLTLSGCFPSSSSNDNPVTPPVVSDFKVNFLQGAPAVDWGAAVTLTAFRPGQASYEFLNTDAHNGITGTLTNNMACSGCHDSNPVNPPQVAAGHDEDLPVPDVATVDISVQAAYDASNFYLKASWQAPRPGITHGILTRLDGAWINNSTALEPATIELPAGKVYSAEDRFGVMFMPAARDISTGASFHKAGCFVTCHADMDDMPEWNVDEIETTKYLISSSNPATLYDVGTETNAQVADGTTTGFPDMWHWRGGRSAAVQTVTDGFVMQTRAGDTGQNPYLNNFTVVDNVTTPVWMYDADWMAAYLEANFPAYSGDKALNVFPGELWNDALDNAPPLITEGPSANVTAYAAAGDIEGGILPRIALRLPDTRSRDNVKAFSSWENGTWTLVMQRARETAANDDHNLNPNVENYTFAFSVFQNHTQHRWHHVTFPVTLGMEGSSARIKAKLN